MCELARGSDSANVGLGTAMNSAMPGTTMLVRIALSICHTFHVFWSRVLVKDHGQVIEAKSNWLAVFVTVCTKAVPSRTQKRQAADRNFFCSV